MILRSMTATFGKLEHETLRLEPGLNVVSGSNEWGKSTWCAFLGAMLYGLDTRARTTRTALSDKARYQPWSGSPMSGRIDLTWQGRNITIERKTTGRIPLGDFRAYETDTGAAVPELTGANCGEMLLGVERSVFTRTSFIRFRDLNVTDDEALRRRLNNLVTTGDENSAADRLGDSLRELKNRIRYNRTGLLPQAEARRQQLEERLRELEELESQTQLVIRKLDEVEDWSMALKNHLSALEFEEAREDERKVSRAEEELEQLRSKLESLSGQCRELPDAQTAQELLEEIRRLEDARRELESGLRAIPAELPPVELPEQFEDISGQAALEWAVSDAARYRDLKNRRNLWAVFGLVLALAGLLMLKYYLQPGLVCCGIGLGVLVWAAVRHVRKQREVRLLREFYGSDEPRQWIALAARYADGLARLTQGSGENHARRRELEQQLQTLDANIDEATQGRGLDACRRDWEEVLRLRQQLAEAQEDYLQSREHLDALRSMARTAPPPDFPDRLDYAEADTRQLLSDCGAERQRLENLRGQYRGRMEALGARSELSLELARVKGRIAQLEKTWTALTIAQETLAEASSQLQRRFAPRIARRTEQLMQRMTGGRYSRLTLEADLTLRAGTDREDTLRGVLCRSDGTIDQLYLALRLAVSEELIPQAPLILDDALVRFDDLRLKAALEILKEMSRERQVILFTCHSREGNML